MGYRVGWQCFANRESADDYILSQQQPVIGADGSIIRPIKQGQHWYLQGKPVVLSYPKCNIAEQMSLGAMVGAGFVAIFAFVALFKTVYGMIYSIGGDDGH